MYIIIAGAGGVGSHIASLLIEAKHEVAIVEQSSEVVDNIRHRLEVHTIIGTAATPKILKETEVHRADLVIAVTNNDETNMLTCFLAKELGATMTVARVRNPEYSGYFVTAAKSSSTVRKIVRPKSLGIDLFINPEFEAAKEIIENSPLLPQYERKFKNDAMIRAVHHSTHIEGNELGLEEAKEVVSGRKVEIKTKERDWQEVINYRNVLNYIERLQSETITLSHILDVHKILSENLMSEKYSE